MSKFENIEQISRMSTSLLSNVAGPSWANSLTEVAEEAKAELDKVLQKHPDYVGNGRIVTRMSAIPSKEFLLEKIKRFRCFMKIPHNSYIFDPLMEKLSDDDLAVNRVSEGFILEDGSKINSGMKISRIFSKLQEEVNRGDNRPTFSIRVVEEYSRIFNGRIDDATVLISVNPADFLSMSFGRSWSSCYGENGEFNTGPVEHAVDKTSVLFSIMPDSARPGLISGEVGSDWYSKTSRQIFHLKLEDGDLKGFVRSVLYPDNALSFVKDGFTKILTGLFHSEEYENGAVNFVSSETAYDDVGYRPYEKDSFVKTTETEETVRIIQGALVGRIPCTKCGHTGVSTPREALCWDCEEREVECEACGCEFSEDMIGYSDRVNMEICEDCESEIVRAVDTGDYGFMGNFYSLVNEADLTEYYESYSAYTKAKEEIERIEST